jgi:hypothetical protein
MIFHSQSSSNPPAMTRSPFRFIIGTLAAVCALTPGASAIAQALPPVHPLGPVEHVSTGQLTTVSAVRALPGGRLLVNDIGGRKLVLFDPTLSDFVVVADTTSATANAYSSRAAGLIAYKGDSSLFVDPTSLSMLVIDGGGTVTRVMSVPRPNDANALVGGGNGTPGFDAQGRLIYRAPPLFKFAPRSPDAPFAAPTFPDTAALVRIDLNTRKLDTIGFVKVPKINMSMTQDANGRMTITSITNPMPVTDDWAVMADGSIAILRSQDYHIDWIRGDGPVTSSPKVPFAWRHLDDSTKVAFIDSAKVAMEKLRADANAKAAANGGNLPFVGDGGGGGGGAGPQMVIKMSVDGGGSRGDTPRQPNTAGGANSTTAPVAIPPLTMVAPSDLPDYAPPFTAGASRGDLDGNLWVRTSNVQGGGSVYDVISGKGELIDRVLVPAGRVIAGFGRGGVVYMGVRDGAGARLEQARRKLAM